MLNTKLLNDYLGTSYSMDEIVEMDPLLVSIVVALKRGFDRK